MRILVLLILLGFPALDVYLTVQVAALTRIPAWALFAAGTIAGYVLLRNERVAFRAKSLAALSGRTPLMASMLDSGRKVLAGVLFILPGVISDIAALVLLALPINLTGGRLQTQTGTGGVKVFNGEYRRLD
jgi:UPF0716 protein FxsA